MNAAKKRSIHAFTITCTSKPLVSNNDESSHHRTKSTQRQREKNGKMLRGGKDNEGLNQTKLFAAIL